MPPSEIRKEAREALKGKWGKAVCTTLIFLAFSFIFEFAQKFLEYDFVIYNILDLIFLVVSIPLSFGLTIVFMQLKRNENVGVFSFIKEGFSRLGKAFGIWLHTLLKLLLPIIGLILALMIFLVLNTALTQLNSTLTLLVVALLITTTIYIACRALLYVLAYNISYDNPELSSKECVNKSEELMKGHRGNYFLLMLYFVALTLVVVIALTIVLFIVIAPLFNIHLLVAALLSRMLIIPISMIYITTYMQVATVCFYERVLNNKK